MADTPGQPATPAPAATPPPTSIPTPAAAATPAPAQAPKPTPTVLAEPGPDPGPGPADWPDDWREKMATSLTGKSEGKDYDKAFKRLERMKSPVDPLKSFISLETKFKKGEDPDPFPIEGTDEEKTAWRDKKGLPKEAGEYLKDFTLDEGLVIGDDDRPVVDEYLKTAHAANMPTNTVRDNLNWYFANRDKQIQARTEKDDEEKTATRDELRDEMGADFNKNLGAAYGLLESAPEGVKDQLLGARLADGKLLGNDAQVLRWLAGTALELNPAATITPGKGAGSLASLQSRKAEIEKVMREDRNKYYRDKLDVEYQGLVEAENKMNKRSAA